MTTPTPSLGRGAALVRLASLDVERVADLLTSSLPLTTSDKRELYEQALGDLLAWAYAEGLPVFGPINAVLDRLEGSDSGARADEEVA